MAKILKVTMAVVTTVLGSNIDRTYPPECDHTKIKMLCDEASLDSSTVIARNDGTAYCFGVVLDKDAPAFLASDSIVEIDEATANTLGSVLRPQVDKLTNYEVVLPILAKLRASQAITQEEDDAVNPDKASVGVNKSNPFSDLLTNTLATVV